MAATLAPVFLAIVSLFLNTVSSLQVTPNSPCASFCLDSDGLDKSDPNSSNTKSSDITCEDNAFDSSEKGRKFQRCLSCLQGSSFSQGSENDQQWFLYNLRYSVNYCVFGFPNATDVGSNPCMTSEACGPLATTLKNGIIDPAHADPYAYCDAGGEPSLGYAYDKCLKCVHAGGTHSYLSNFVVALEAGCQQQPPSGTLVGLNETVFSGTVVEIVAPSTEADNDEGQGVHLSATVIAGISVGSLVFLLLVAGCIYMRLRKKKNRVTIARRRRASPLSFQCQTHLTPRDMEFFRPPETPTFEKPYLDPGAALSSNPIDMDSSWATPPEKAIGAKSQAAKYPHISITTSLPTPPPIHSSPQRASPDDYMSPQSTTSTRSNAPLLPHRPYVPSDYANSPPQKSISTFSPVLTISSPQRTSPLTTYSEPFWEEPPPKGSGRDLTKKNGFGNTTKVEARVLQTSFPPPPKR